MSRDIEGENEHLKRIDSIDTEKEIFKIMEDTSSFFKSYTEKIKDPLFMMFAYFSILFIMRKLDTNEELCAKTSGYFMEKYSQDQWMNRLINFYTYYLSVVEYLMEKHNDTILDAYNEKLIGKEAMEKSMTTFEETKKGLMDDQKEISNCIKEIQEEKERI